jgi:hypothetical protein
MYTIEPHTTHGGTPERRPAPASTVRRPPAAGRDSFSIIVPVKNHLKLTWKFIDSVRTRNAGTPVEWVIVDSGSTDGTVDYCERIGARVVRHEQTPFNYCAAVNAGAAAATGDFWIVANNDIEFQTIGDLERLARLFRQWPLLSVVSPGREEGDADLEFGLGWLYGACWAVRPEAFRSWGGMPESLSGYGYDEVYTIAQCWRRGYGLGWLSGWSVLHHGAQTFGPEGGNTTPVMRRNLSRLLEALDARDLDRGNNRQRIVDRLLRRERDRAPARLLVPEGDGRWLERQGYSGARAWNRREPPPEGASWVCGPMPNRERRQWLPWLANELLLQPAARIVGAHGWYALRERGDSQPPDAAALDALIWEARAEGPLPQPLMPPARPAGPGLRGYLGQLRHDLRHRRSSLPLEW